MTQDELKALVGQAALAYVVPGSIVGVGTGSTVNCFIDALATMKDRIRGAVSSSVKSTERLQALGIPVFDANTVESIPVYIDGADEIDHAGYMVKGGGAALTREKIVADLADQFVCIADASKLVQTLGKFPLPVEVIPMAVPRLIRAGRFIRPALGVDMDEGLNSRITQALEVWLEDGAPGRRKPKAIAALFSELFTREAGSTMVNTEPLPSVLSTRI